MKASSQKPLFIILLGRPGSGKGTQADLLEKKFNLWHISTGQLLRNRMKRRDFIGKHIGEILDEGNLVPTPIVFQLWMPRLEKFRMGYHHTKGILFDGSPRKLYEARMLDELIQFYGWSDRVLALHINVSPKEAMKRLLKRQRHDDEKSDIKNRLAWFQKEVVPVIKFYQSKKILLTINGQQSVDAVHKDVLKKLNIAK